MEAHVRGAPDRARRTTALALGTAALAVSLVGTVMSLVAPSSVADRIGLYTSVGGLDLIVNVGIEIDAVLLLGAGVLICVRMPRHPIGWLLLASGSLMAVGIAAGGYMYSAFTDDPVALPAAEAAAWLYNWVWGPLMIVLAVTLFLFPTGRAVSAGWTWVFGALLVVGAIAVLLNVLYPSPMPQTLAIENLLSVPVLATIPEDVLRSTFFTVVVLLAFGAASMIARYRRSAPLERLQLRWVAAASTLVAVTFGVLAARGPWDTLSDLGLFSVLATIPIAIGIAILRYRLYAIDVIIRRTLIYGTLTITLGLCYATVVFVSQVVLAGFAGQDWLTVATATLLVAAAFRPLRSRIQTAMDRRFFRVHYDATRTATDLADRLRGEMELDVIEADLVATVSATMQPTRIGFWERG